MELCPSTQETAVEPDDRGKNLRKILHFLYYGELLLVGLKFFTIGSWQGIFQLVNLWVIYTSYATLNFCSCLIYSIMCGMQLLFLSADWKVATGQVPTKPG